MNTMASELGDLGHDPQMAAVKAGELDVHTKEMLATQFCCWSGPEEEAAHWLLRVQERITASN